MTVGSGMLPKSATGVPEMLYLESVHVASEIGTHVVACGGHSAPGMPLLSQQLRCSHERVRAAQTQARKGATD